MIELKTIRVQDCWNRIGVWGNEQPRCAKLETVVHCHNCDVYSDAARLLRQRKPPSGYRREWTLQYAQQPSADTEQSESALMFRLGSEWFGIPVHAVAEVLPAGTVHRIPHRASPLLQGVVSVRGRLQLCVSLHDLLEVERTRPSAERRRTQRSYPRLVVLEKSLQVFAFEAEEVSGTVRYAPAQLADVPATLPRPVAMHHRGVLPAPDRQVGCLDDELLFYTLSRSIT